VISNQLLALCRFVSETDLNSIPDHVVDQAKLVLIDTLGVIIAGTLCSEVTGIIQRFSKYCPLDTGITCPGRTEALDPLNAALINGIAGSSLEYDGGNSRAMGHPGIQVVPAVMVASEIGSSPGADLLAGLISGYEVCCRVSRATLIRNGLHPTGTWGTVGSALGVGCINRRSPEELIHIANIAASYAFSPYVKNSFVGRNVASTFAGLVNYVGVLANLFFESGFRADKKSFEMTFSRFVSESFDAEALETGLGQAYAITENYFKPYPTCRFTHPTIDALKAILEKTRILPDDVAGISVSSFKAAVHTNSEPPDNVGAMRFSLPYQIAVMLTYGKIDLETLNEDSLQNPLVAALAEKVKMVFCPEYEQLRPRNNPARVTVLLNDGRRFSHEVMNCLGDPLKPMSEQTIYDKFLSLTEPTIGLKKAREALKRLTRLEYEDDVRPLFLLFRSNK